MVVRGFALIGSRLAYHDLSDPTATTGGEDPEIGDSGDRSADIVETAASSRSVPASILPRQRSFSPAVIAR